MAELERYYRIVRKPRVTEKGLKMVERHRAYPFEVAPAANKIEIRTAVEKLFNVKVGKVRTVRMHGKMRRVRWRPGYTGDWKKAYVQLKPGSTIEFFETETEK